VLTPPAVATPRLAPRKLPVRALVLTRFGLAFESLFRVPTRRSTKNALSMDA
jgi:hypothetical protein